MENLVSVCAWCRFVKTPVGWLQAAKAFRILKIQGPPAPEETTHGICPTCALDWVKMDRKSFEDACQKEAYATA